MSKTLKMDLMLLINYKIYHLCHLNLEDSFINSNYGLLLSMFIINNHQKSKNGFSYITNLV